MSSTAKVLSFQDIEDLRSALIRFRSEALEELNVAEREVQQTLNHLEECQRIWQIQKTMRQDMVRRAAYAVQQQPSHANTEELMKAKKLLLEAEGNVSSVRLALSTLQQPVETYRRQAQRLSTLLDDDVPKATALLQEKIASLYDYTAMGASTGRFTPLSPDMLSPLPPVQVQDTPSGSGSHVEHAGGTEREPNKESLEGQRFGPAERR